MTPDGRTTPYHMIKCYLVFESINVLLNFMRLNFRDFRSTFCDDLNIKYKHLQIPFWTHIPYISILYDNFYSFIAILYNRKNKTHVTPFTVEYINLLTSIVKPVGNFMSGGKSHRSKVESPVDRKNKVNCITYAVTSRPIKS
jgi:hypothetical protein